MHARVSDLAESWGCLPMVAGVRFELTTFGL
jgi:hypothetical protein